MMGKLIKVRSDRPNFLTDALSQTFADVFLCCSGGQRFLAHRLVLSAASSYLHEVLLAHGKITGHCEPTTVILAEVEGHDLAAILGFLYTGSVAVPSARLEAFSSAADALKIQIPPLPLALKDQTSIHKCLNNNNNNNNNNNQHTHKYSNLNLTSQNSDEEEDKNIDFLATNNSLDEEQYNKKGLNLKIDKTNCLRRLLMSETNNNIKNNNLTLGNNYLSSQEIIKIKSHIANRVFASPWCQLQRPYHYSPKSRVILRNSESCCKNIYDASTDSSTSERHENIHETSPSASSTTTVGVEVLSKPSLTLNHDDLRHVADNPQNSIITEIVSYPVTTTTTIATTDVDQTHSNIYSNSNQYANDKTKENMKLHTVLPTIGSDLLNNRSMEQFLDSPSKIINNFDEDTGKLCTVRFNDDNNNNNSNNNNNNASENDHNDGTVKSDVNIDMVSTISSHDPDDLEDCKNNAFLSSSLKTTDRNNLREKPFKCTDCGKEFSQLRNYKYHRSLHEGTGEFAATCPECGKYFNDRGYLGSHMKIHRNRKEYVCNECGKSFNQRVAYNMHVRIHTGLKPHHCDQCGKSFSRKMLLKQHLRTHSGERPYQCHICNKAFADRSNMTLHTRLHSGLKPYQCDICSKAFTKKHHLKTHLNYHTGTKPYSCPNCTLTFSQSSNMRTHYKKCINNKSSDDIENKKESEGSNNNNIINCKSKKSQRSSVVKFSVALTPPHSDLESQTNIRDIS